MLFWLLILISIICAAGVGSFLYISSLKRKFEQQLESEQKKIAEAERQISQLKEKLRKEEEASQVLRESREKLRRALYHDMLTGLPRKELFQESLKLMLEERRSSRFNNTFSVVLVEFEEFRRIDEVLGSINGDRLIKEATERIKNVIKPNDFLARLEGARFGLILTNSDESETRRVIELLKRKLSYPFKVKEQEISLNSFFGASIVNENYSRIDDILRDAKIALQEARETGKNYAIFNQSMHDRLVKLHELEVELQNALKRGEFQPYFQPIVSLNSLTLSGFEVLMRWKHPKRGIIPPGEFIELCEKNGLIEPMTYSILRQACRKLFYWQEMLPDLTISVNLSGTHFSQEDLYGVIESIINESNIMPSSLKLELTEGKIMEDAERAVGILDKFKKLGTQIMIDDFGTGYSNLSYLHRFPVDALKIDRSFVTGMERDSEKAAIVKTIITLAKALGLAVVAEGVENVQQLYQLRELGCQMGQGFLFSKPLPPEMAEKMLLERFNWQHLLPTPQTQPTRQISSTSPIQAVQSVSQARSSQITKEVNSTSGVQKTEPVDVAKEVEQIEAEILDIPIVEANTSPKLIDLSIVEVEDTKLHWS